MKCSKVAVSIGGLVAMLTLPAHSQTACAASAGVVRLSDAQITALLTGRTLCGVPGPSYPGSPGDRWQEEHLANGDLFDYKRGPGHPIDPREKVGTWGVANGNTIGAFEVTYIYGGSLAFSWAVFGPVVNVPGTSAYSFCKGNAEHVRATVIASGAGCASFPALGGNARIKPIITTGKTPAVVTPN